MRTSVSIIIPRSQADAFGYRGTNQGSQLAGNESLWLDGSLDQHGTFRSSGFSSLPSGYLLSFFTSLNGSTFFWSSTESGGTAYFRSIIYTDAKIRCNAFDKLIAFSVRCVKD